MRKQKQVEQKLFEAYKNRRGVKLSADDVEKLILLDDAIRMRIARAACEGLGDPGTIDEAETWKELCDLAEKDRT